MKKFLLIYKNNLHRNKKLNNIMMISLLIIFLLVTIIIIYSDAIMYSMDYYDNLNLTSNLIRINSDKSAWESKKYKNQLSEIKQINEVYQYAESYVMSDFEIINNDKILKKQFFSVIRYIDDFSKAEKLEFDTKFKNQKIIKYGKLFKNKNEFVCTESFLKSLGYCDIESYIGENFTLNIGDDAIFNNKILVGIVDDKFLELDIFGGNFMPMVFLNKNNLESNENSTFFINCYLNSYFNRQSIAENVKNIINTPSFVMELNDAPIMVKLESQKQLFLTIMIVLIIVILMFSIIYLAYEFYKDIFYKKNYYNVLYINGVSKKSLINLIFFNNLIILLLAVIASIILAIPIMYIVNAIITNSLGIILAINFMLLLKIAVIIFVAGLILNLIISLLIMFYLKRAENN